MQGLLKKKMSRVLGAMALIAVAGTVSTPAYSQTEPVLYIGTLMIGFSDQSNLAPFDVDIANNGVPACANANPFLPATFATQQVLGYALQGTTATGTNPQSLQFQGYAPVNGTAQTGGGSPPILDSTCIVQFPPFLGGQLRSRVQFGSQVWPGQKWLSETAGGQINLTTGAGGGTLAAGAGNTQMNAITWVTENVFPNASTAPGGTTPQITTMIRMDSGISFAPQNFYGTAGQGRQVIVPGANSFGGGVPVNGNGAVQLGVNTNIMNTAGTALLATFGVRNYANGFLPTGPALYGTDAVNPTPATSTAIPVGLRGGNSYVWQFHTEGPTGTAATIPLTVNLGWSQGADQTVGGGNTATGAPGPLLSTPGDFDGIFQKWTTGYVQHVDTSGMYQTIRSATGFDNTGLTTGTAPSGTTRRLQLVSPWSASIQQRLTQPWAPAIETLPDFGFGGLAVLTLNITPVPEPGTMMMLGFGAAGLLGLRSVRRRS